ncbi:hypothetical protein J1614_011186 [Plenodomus biglobosus]|nr:hypothetical protein J1614_011186 [Plenodomus biglobosus]
MTSRHGGAWSDPKLGSTRLSTAFAESCAYKVFLFWNRWYTGTAIGDCEEPPPYRCSEYSKSSAIEFTHCALKYVSLRGIVIMKVARQCCLYWCAMTWVDHDQTSCHDGEIADGSEAPVARSGRSPFGGKVHLACFSLIAHIPATAIRGVCANAAQLWTKNISIS